MKCDLFLIGAGKMATAIAGGLVKSGLFAPAELLAFDINPAAAAEFTKTTGVECATANCFKLAMAAKRILLAVKPQALTSALSGLKDALAGKTILSIVAGVPLQRLSELTGSQKVIRVMPNTPAQIGKGASAIAVSPEVDETEQKLAETIFSAVGTVLLLDEHHLDAVTALSGSGPAYVFAFLQALSDGGVASGLPRAAATELALQTVIGAAEMVRSTGQHPAVLKDQVTSPGGTTIRALEVLEKRAFAGTIIEAVRAACMRSEELGRSS